MELTQNIRGITERDNKFGGAVNPSISHPAKNQPESPIYNEIKAEIPKMVAITVKRRLYLSWYLWSNSAMIISITPGMFSSRDE